MLSISPHLFVLLILSCVLAGVGVCLLVTLPSARSMRKTNAEYQNQVGVQGIIWQEIFDRQQNECDRWSRIAGDMERRVWVLLRMGHGEKKGAMSAMADKMLGEPDIPLPTNNARPRHRGPRTGPEEVKLARQARLDQMVSQGRGIPLGVPESMDGTNSKPE